MSVIREYQKLSMKVQCEASFSTKYVMEAICDRSVIMRNPIPPPHREEADCDHEHEQPQLLVCLVEGVDEGLEPREVTHQLEDPHDPHHPHQPDDLT